MHAKFVGTGFGAFFALAFLAAGAPADLEVQRDLLFTNVAAVDLRLDAYLPKSAAPSPGLIWVHGGGFVAGDKKDYPKLIIDRFLDRGFALFSVNYRLAPKHPFPACVDDVECAIRFVRNRKEFRVDANRLVLMGESAGGLIVSVAGARAREAERVSAVVSFYGEHDLVLRVEENPCIMDGRAVPKPAGGCLSPGIAALLGIQEVNADTMKIVRQASAVSYVHKGMPPFLLIHGTREFHVPFEQSVSMKMAMEKAGADCTLLPILGGAHGVGGWEKLPQAREYKEQLLDWVERRIKQ